MRMNRTIRIGLFFIGLGLLAVLLFFVIGPLIGALFSGGERTAQQPAEDGSGATEVTAQARGIRVVAREAIPPKSIITREMLTTDETPADAPADDFVADPDAIVGYITQEVEIPAGQPIHKADLVGHITQVGTAGLLRRGERAIVIPLNQPTLHDLVKVGDYVDVIAAFEGQEANTIVRGVRVLAVDLTGSDYPPVSLAQRGPHRHPPANADINAVPTPTPTPDPNAPPGQQAAPAAQATPAGDAPPPAAALTLEVTPEEATRISLAQAANARIDFVLIPREEILLPGETGVVNTGTEAGDIAASITQASLTTAASTILPEVAPYSARLKRAGAANNGSNNGTAVRVAETGGVGGGGNGSPVPRPESYPPPIPEPVSPAFPGGGAPVVEPPVPTPPPATYQVKIIPDGKEVRYETVLKPVN